MARSLNVRVPYGDVTDPTVQLDYLGSMVNLANYVPQAAGFGARSRESMAVLLALGALLGMPLPAQAVLRTELEVLAKSIPCLPQGMLLYDRPVAMELRSGWLAPAERDALEQYHRNRRRYAPDELAALLEHPDAKVRVLAIGAVHVGVDPRVGLPLLHRLVNDPALGFAAHNGGSYALAHLPSLEEMRRLELGKPVTVGQVAADVLGFHMSRAHSRYGPVDTAAPYRWQDYWEERAERTHCLSWFAVALDCATGGTTPFQADRRELVAALRARLDRLPADERNWYLLCLADPDSHPLVTVEERLAIAKAIGGQALLAYLRGAAPFADPDLEARDSNDARRRGVLAFVLAHATELLPPACAEELLVSWRQQRAHAAANRFAADTAQWPAAAMRLAPDRAEAIFAEALQHHRAAHPFAQNDRAHLHWALWQVRGPAALTKLRDYTFAEVPAPGAVGFGRSLFFQFLGPQDEPLLLALLRDDRLTTLDAGSLYQLGLATNRVAGRTIVTEAELQQLPHPSLDADRAAIHARILAPLQRYATR